MTEFTSKWLTWEPPETLKVGTDKSAKSPPATLETSRVRTDKTDRSPFGSFGSAYSTHSQGNVAALGEVANEEPAGSIGQDADSAISADSPSPGASRPTPETPRVDTAKTDKRWDPETAALIQWFLGTEPPTGPFRLQQAVYIARPDKYWEYLKGDIAAGPSRARGRTGALRDDLQRLYRIFHDGKDIGGGTA